MKKIGTAALIIAGMCSAQLAFSCSNVSISGNGFSAVARTMDLERALGNCS